MTYGEIRIEKIALQSDPDVLLPNLLDHYFIDAIDIAAGGRAYHLDATAISNGQNVLDTLCARVPLHAFCGGEA